jgi:hypothetical protein
MNKLMLAIGMVSATVLLASIDADAAPCNSYTCATGTTISVANTDTNADVYAIYASGGLGASSAAIVGDTTGSSSGSSPGVLGKSTDAAGVAANSINGPGLSAGTSAGGTIAAILGEQSGTGGYGVQGQTSAGSAVYGNDTSSGFGIYGSSSTGTGVYGITSSSSGYAVEGVNNSGGTGVYGSSSQGSKSNAVAGVYAYDTSGGWAIYSNGPENVYNSSYWWTTSAGVQNCVAGLCASDERLKKNIKPLSNALDELLQLKGVTYEWKNPEEQGNQTGTQTGFIAQQVEKSFPNWVSQGKDGIKGIGLPPMQLAALTVESIRELKLENDTLRNQTAKQQAEIDALRDAVARIKNGTDPISGTPGFGHGVLALLTFGLAGASGLTIKLALKRMGVSLATVVGLLLAGRKKDDEKR